MAKNIVLNAEERSADEKVKALRASRIVPGIVYGKTQEALSLKLDASDLLRTYRKAGESHIISLKIGKETIEVLIQDIQFEPITGEIMHIDFFALTRGEKVTTKIHLNFTGDSNAIKEGALLTENVKEIEVSCLPRDLVDSFEVDLTKLENIEDVIRLSDLNIDAEKYEVHHLHPEDAIAVAAKPKVEKEPTEEEAGTTEESAENEEDSKEEGK